MTTDTKYNGWTNYETWAVKLWLDNEQSTYSYWLDAAAEAWQSAESDPQSRYWNRSRNARFPLADRLKDELKESAPDLGASLWSDLLSAALSEVNWTEIADNMLRDHDDCQGYVSQDDE